MLGSNSPTPESNPGPRIERWSLSHWTAWEVPQASFCSTAFHTSSPFYQASPSSWWHSRPFSSTSPFPHALLFSSGYWELNLPSLMTRGLSETPAELQSPGRREGGAQRQGRPTLRLPNACPEAQPALAWPPGPALLQFSASCFPFRTPPCHVTATQLPTSGTKPRMGEQPSRAEVWMKPEEGVLVSCQGIWGIFLDSPAVTLDKASIASLVLSGLKAPRPPS